MPMGTRGVLQIRRDGKIKVSVYSQFDTYPSGLGRAIVDFIRTMDDSAWESFIQNLNRIRKIPPNYSPTEQEITDHLAYYNEIVSTGSKHDVYNLLRELQGDGILHAIKKGDIYLCIYTYDMQWCEYLYIIDLDEMCLEVTDLYGDVWDIIELEEAMHITPIMHPIGESKFRFTFADILNDIVYPEEPDVLTEPNE